MINVGLMTSRCVFDEMQRIWHTLVNTPLLVDVTTVLHLNKL